MALPENKLTKRDDYAPTIDDEAKVKKGIEKLAAQWDVSLKEAAARCLRMGVNRYAALARHHSKVVAIGEKKYSSIALNVTRKLAAKAKKVTKAVKVKPKAAKRAPKPKVERAEAAE